MQQENAKMWEEKYEKNPVVKEIIKEYHHTESGWCNIF